ncbi:MAG: RlmE family RNA methyltransferase [Candidatus Thermoplasmatota archaeon]|nr:RlmE family RNA methyltransferase [Candidatus Thermoplasmatota archaeon]MEC9350709.1 RlmE family RNA methyltransferase [Candidatus Thermoplasmatota archaeon]MED6312641.1 RlmE family RNA methyltransferase [Candidatus Thermoplasmatota archaeon]|tara:strand:+ start:223 stop:972 length:750 start_codon:yes stop_codon:yes gene_type:complete
MSKRWYQENRRDPWRRQAKSKGYRSRSAYKLKQIQEKFQLIRESDAILDVGCHPGGWTQVSVEESGPEGLVIGVDLKSTSPVEGASIIQGDISDQDTIDRIEGLLEGRELNVVLSDISPKLTGRYDTDQAISLELSTMTLDVAMGMLASGGSFVTKIFQGVGIEGLIRAAKDRFSSVQRFAPMASRNASSETYLVCRNRLPKPRKSARGKSAFSQVQEHLTEVGVNFEGEDESEEIATGFRTIRKNNEN